MSDLHLSRMRRGSAAARVSLAITLGWMAMACTRPAGETCPTENPPGYELSGVPAGWVRNVDRLEPSGYQIVYTAPVSGTDPLAAVEAIGRRISLLVTFDPTGQARVLAATARATGRPAQR